MLREFSHPSTSGGLWSLIDRGDKRKSAINASIYSSYGEDEKVIKGALGNMKQFYCPLTKCKLVDTLVKSFYSMYPYIFNYDQ